VTWWERDPGASNCRVVVNDEEQYALWPHDAAVPAGWRDTGFVGTAEQCAGYVNAVWTDMRPRSVRDRLENGDQVTDPGPTGSA
jgi:MbtH protein